MNSSELLSLIRALAGNPHDCCWSHLPFSSSEETLTTVFGDELTTAGMVTAGSVHRNLYTVATGIYPIEVDDEMSATALLVNGFQLADQVESFQPSAQLTAGEVITILVPVDFSQYPEAFQPSAHLTAGLVYEVYTPVSFSQYPEAFLPSAQLLSGAIIDEPGNVTITNPDETMTSTAWLVDGTLE